MNTFGKIYKGDKGRRLCIRLGYVIDFYRFTFIYGRLMAFFKPIKEFIQLCGRYPFFELLYDFIGDLEGFENPLARNCRYKYNRCELQKFYLPPYSLRILFYCVCFLFRQIPLI